MGNVFLSAATLAALNMLLVERGSVSPKLRDLAPTQAAIILSRPSKSGESRIRGGGDGNRRIQSIENGEGSPDALRQETSL